MWNLSNNVMKRFSKTSVEVHDYIIRAFMNENALKVFEVFRFPK